MPDIQSQKRGKHSRRLAWQLALLAILATGAMMTARNQKPKPYHRNSGTIFGTIYNITYQCDSNLNDQIRRELLKVDASLSAFNEKSVLSAINRNETCRADSMLEHVFKLARKVSEETDGAFDITVAPLVNIWGFGFSNGSTPTQEAIDSIRSFTGYKLVTMSGGTITKADPRTMLDCSAIAKGYGSDVVASFLRSKGVKNFMVEIGGEIVTSGISEKRVPWRIGVTKPAEDSLCRGEELQTIINVTDKAMATSGNYRNYYYRDGKRYAHTIDPHTGYPVQHNILSSTVLADDCATADAYATAFMVMGLEKAQAVLKRHPELMAYFICSSDNGKDSVWYSPSMRDKIEE